VGPFLPLLVKHELQRREGQVAPERGAVTVEERAEALGADDRPYGVYRALVVIPGVEVGVVVATLQLQTGLDNF